MRRYSKKISIANPGPGSGEASSSNPDKFDTPGAPGFACTTRSVGLEDYRKKNFYFFYNAAMMVFGTIFILPVRAIFFLAVVLMGLLVNGLLKLWRFDAINSDQDYFQIDRKPHFQGSWYKTIVFWIVYYGWRTLAFACGGYYIQVYGQENIDKENCKLTVVAPHVAMAGTDVIPGEIMDNRFPMFVSKIGTKCPYFDALDFIYVDRASAESKRNCVKTQMHRIFSEDWRDSFQVVFPEGTTTNGRYLQKFSKGAFLSGAPVQPVVTEFPCAVNLLIRKTKCISAYLKQFSDKFPFSPDMLMSPLRRYFPEIAKKPSASVNKPWSDYWETRNVERGAGWHPWTSETNSTLNILYLLTNFWQPIIFTVLPVYYPDDNEKRDPVLYAENVRRVMARAAGVQLTDQNRLDTFVVMHLNQRFPECFEPDIADQIFVSGGLLEEEFGTKVLDTKEICQWSEEWWRAGLLGRQTLRNFVRDKLRTKVQ